MLRKWIMTALLATAVALPVSLMAKHQACGEANTSCQCTKEKNCGCDMNLSKCTCDKKGKKGKMCDGKKGKVCDEKNSCGCKGEKKAPVCETKPKCGCSKDANATIVIEPVKK